MSVREPFFIKVPLPWQSDNHRFHFKILQAAILAASSGAEESPPYTLR
jgi:hypothetical protein